MIWRNSPSSSRPSLPRSSSRWSTALPTLGFALWAAAVIAIAFAVLSTGCACGDRVIAPAGEPRIVTEATGRVRLAAYDARTREFVDLGWHDARGMAGWTLSVYDWEAEPEP